MIVDIYTHVFPRAAFERMTGMMARPEEAAKRLQNMRMIHDLDARFREMDEFGDYRQIISLPNPRLEALPTPKAGVELLRFANDAMAEIVQKHPDRFPAFVATLPMLDVDAALAEIDHAVGQLGAKGIQLFTHVGGRPLDEPAFKPVFDRMAEIGLPIWLHPARSPALTDYESEKRSRFEAFTVLGWPYATSVAMLRLVYSGLFDRHPGIKIITHHCGGIIPYHEGRLDHAFVNLGRRGAGEDYASVKAALKRPFVDYFKMFYGDTAMHGAVNPVRCGLEFFGPRNVVYASDAPFSQIRKNIDAIYRLDIGEEDRRMIFCGNAERLMKMKFA
jgi:predicted TIM-barrel fold metal-dependent hydrolase